MRVDNNDQMGGEQEGNAKLLSIKDLERAVGFTPETLARAPADHRPRDARVRAVQALLSDLAQTSGGSLVRGCCGQGCCHQNIETASSSTADADGRSGT